jgi:hypothetical protein
MIKLEKQEEIQIHQTELTLKIKSKESPFIAILILALENEQIDESSLQEHLLPSLPLRACKNLLLRLKQQGYLENWGNYFELTEIGKLSAENKSYWQGEKGLYDIYTTENQLSQNIIKTTKVDRPEDDRNNGLKKTPPFILEYEKETLTINKTETLFEDIEQKCFQLKSISAILQIESSKGETILKFIDKKILFSKDYDSTEKEIQNEILLNCNEFRYKEGIQGIETFFDKTELSFLRSITINRPIYSGIAFNSLKLENIRHIPIDEENAKLWFEELLYTKIDTYYTDDKLFVEFASTIAKPFQEYNKIFIPKRKEFSNKLNERENSFYKIAKLTAIDFLNY